MHHGTCQRVCVSDTRTLRTRDKCPRRHQSIDDDTCAPRVLRSVMCMMLIAPSSPWRRMAFFPFRDDPRFWKCQPNFTASASPGGICFATEDRPFGMVRGWPRKCIGGNLASGICSLK